MTTLKLFHLEQTQFGDILDNIHEKTPITIINHNGAVFVGRVMGVEAEDGSGRSFNLRLLSERLGNHSAYIRYRA